MVKDYKKLTHVTSNMGQIPTVNIFNPIGMIEKGKMFNPSNNQFLPNPQFATCYVPIKSNTTYTIYEKEFNSAIIPVVSQDRVYVNKFTVNRTNTLTGKFTSRRVFTTNTLASNVTHMALPVLIDPNIANHGDPRTSLMVFEGDVTLSNNNDFIPHCPDGIIVLNGDKIDIAFDNTNTHIASSSIIEGIKELSLLLSKAIKDITISGNQMTLTKFDESTEIRQLP
jgi:hypothetical protein